MVDLAGLATTLQIMSILLAFSLFLIGGLVGFVAGLRNADSKRLKAAVAAAEAVKDVVSK